MGRWQKIDQISKKAARFNRRELMAVSEKNNSLPWLQ
jgi:hypothetical protein